MAEYPLPDQEQADDTETDSKAVLETDSNVDDFENDEAESKTKEVNIINTTQDQRSPDPLLAECPRGECSAWFVALSLVEKSVTHFQQLYVDVKDNNPRSHDHWFLEPEDFGVIPKSNEDEQAETVQPSSKSPPNNQPNQSNGVKETTEKSPKRNSLFSLLFGSENSDKEISPDQTQKGDNEKDNQQDVKIYSSPNSSEIEKIDEQTRRRSTRYYSCIEYDENDPNTSKSKTVAFNPAENNDGQYTSPALPKDDNASATNNSYSSTDDLKDDRANAKTTNNVDQARATENQRHFDNSRNPNTPSSSGEKDNNATNTPTAHKNSPEVLIVDESPSDDDIDVESNDGYSRRRSRYYSVIEVEEATTQNNPDDLQTNNTILANNNETDNEAEHSSIHRGTYESDMEDRQIKPISSCKCKKDKMEKDTQKTHTDFSVSDSDTADIFNDCDSCQ